MVNILHLPGLIFNTRE